MTTESKPPILKQVETSNDAPPNSGQKNGGKFTAAAAIASKQLELTKLTTLTLPGLYKQLGTQIYKMSLFKEEQSQLYSELEQLATQLEQLKSIKASGEGFSAKSKAALNSAKDMAHAKLIESRIRGSLQKLGISSYCTAKQTPELLVNCDNIDGCLHKIETLKLEISKCKNVFKVSSWFSGNVSKLKIAAYAFVSLAVIFIILKGFSTKNKEVAVQRDYKNLPILLRADKSWESNNRDTAADDYQQLADDYHFRLDADVQTKRRVFNRLIDYRLEVGGIDQARKYILDAINQDILITLTYPNWQDVIKQVKSDDEREASRRESHSNRTRPMVSGPSNYSKNMPSGSYSARDNNSESDIHVKPDGTVSGSFKGQGISGKSTINPDGSGEGEYNINGQKLRIKIGSDGNVITD